MIQMNFFFAILLVKYNCKKSLWPLVFITVLNENHEKLMVVSENVSSFSGEANLNLTTDVLYPLTSPKS